MKEKNKILELFTTTASISATTNGGWAIVAAMKDKFIAKNNWIEEEEMLDLVAIAQSCPGPIAINASVLVGYRIAGLTGAFATLLGTTLPPLIFMSLVTVFYDFFAKNQYVMYFMHGMQAGVTAMITSVAIDLFTNIAKKNSVFYYALMALAFVANYFLKISILYIAIFVAIAGIVKTCFLVKEVK